MGGRVVEGSGLENRHTCKRIVGSNPTPSANTGAEHLRRNTTVSNADSVIDPTPKWNAPRWKTPRSKTPGRNRLARLSGRRGSWAAAAIAIIGFVVTHLAMVGPSSTSLSTESFLLLMSGVPHTLAYTGLGVVFGRSLLPGQDALVSRLARRVEPNPVAAVLGYTRRVTWLWTIFCAVQLMISASLLAAAPLSTWSAFVTLANVPLVVVTFLGEYAVRCHRFNDLPMASLLDTIRAFTRRGVEIPTCDR
jgi:uncharacterized membrane protein